MRSAEAMILTVLVMQFSNCVEKPELTTQLLKSYS